MERKILMAIERKGKQTEIVRIGKSSTACRFYGIQKWKQSKCVYELQGRNWWCYKKSVRVSNCLSKNNYWAGRRKKSKDVKIITIASDILRVRAIMVG